MGRHLRRQAQPRLLTVPPACARYCRSHERRPDLRGMPAANEPAVILPATAYRRVESLATPPENQAAGMRVRRGCAAARVALVRCRRLRRPSSLPEMRGSAAMRMRPPRRIV